MGKKDEFKVFVRQHPELIKYVEDNSMTWQDFYELFDLYGDSSNVWDKYFNNNINVSNNIRWFDIINSLRNIDVDKVQEGITSLQKALGLVSDLFVKDKDNNTNNYIPRPLYRSFED